MSKFSQNIKVYISIIVMIVVGAAGYYLYGRLQPVAAGSNDANGNVTATATTSQSPAVPVVVTSATLRVFKNSINVQGNLLAKKYAMVSPRIGGTIENIMADEGDKVYASKTRLFNIDAIKLQKNLEIAKQDVAVARCSLLERKANQERVDADLYKTELDYQRFKQLLENEVVTANDFELHELRYKQAQASSKHAKTSIALASEQVSRAEAVLAIAEKNLQDTVIYAPLTGTISKRYMEPGEMGDAGKPVLRIEDTSVIEVSAFIPSHHYNDIIPGQTKMDVQVNRIKVKDQVIIYRSPTINPTLRTFEIKCLIENPPEGMVPGALAEIEVTFDTREAVGVPSVCVVQRRDKQIVFVVDGGQARAVTVNTGWENQQWIEITKGVASGCPVVSMGQNQLNDHTPVKVQKEAM